MLNGTVQHYGTGIFVYPYVKWYGTAGEKCGVAQSSLRRQSYVDTPS